MASPSGEWITEITDHLVDLPQVRQRLFLAANHTAWRTQDHLVVPQHARPAPPHPRAATAEVEIRLTGAVRLVLDAAQRPVPWATLAAKLTAEYPDEPAQSAENLLTQLIRARALLTSLSPTSVETDPLAYLARALDGMVEVSPPVPLLDGTRSVVRIRHRHGSGPAVRAESMKAARHLCDTGRTGIDVRLDATVSLPAEVVYTAEKAAHMLTVLSAYPEGIPAWRGYRDRFAYRYGTDPVPVAEAVHPSTGLGFPHSYTSTGSEAPAAALSVRDRWLMGQAQDAALTGRREVRIEELLAAQETVYSSAPPENTELNLRLESPSRAALDSGRFRLVVLGASRSAGTMAGRFAALTGIETDLAEVLTGSGPLPVQMSFPPQRSGSVPVTRAPRLLKHVLHVAEYPSTGTDALTVDDLFIGDDGTELFLWSRSLQRAVVPVVPHALNLRHAPPLARFLAELPRAGKTVVSGFDWGAASFLPFLPRLRSGRVVVANARWRVTAADLPPITAAWPRWQSAWQAWARSRNLPALVELGEGDQRLRLDLTQPGHLFLLRSHLNKEGATVLTEAPAPDSAGWCDGRPVEILLQLQRKGTV